MVPIKVNKWNSLVQQVEENRQNILTLSEQPPQFDAKGEWNNTTVYAQNDMINYNGSSYFSLQDSNANHTPGASDSAAWWQLLAAKGETGATGATGATGPTGPEGDPGPGVYSASIVDSELYVHTPFVNAPAQGDLIIVNTDETTDANIGNMYIVNNPTGNSHIPLANVQLTGNIRGAQGIQGPKGDPGPTGPAGAPGGGAKYMHIMQLSLMGPPSQYNVRDGWFVVFSNQSTPYTNLTLLSALGGSTSTRFPAYGYVYLYSGGTDFYPISCITLTANSVTVYFRTTPTGAQEKIQGVGITDGVIQVG